MAETYALLETWLKKADAGKEWKIFRTSLKAFHFDRFPDNASRRDTVKLIFPKNINTKARPDPNHVKITKDDSVWIDRHLNNDPARTVN